MTDPMIIANAFNKYFANVGTNLAKEIPNVQCSPMDYLKTPSSNSFYIFPVSTNEIEVEIARLKTRKATGPFSIPIPILKILKSVLAKPLESIFNASFFIGHCPKQSEAW